MKKLIKKVAMVVALICILTVINIGAAMIKTSYVAKAAGEDFEAAHPEMVAEEK